MSIEPLPPRAEDETIDIEDVAAAGDADARSEPIAVADDEDGLRLDRWFKRRWPGVAHGLLERLLRTGQVRVDGRRAKAGERLEVGQCVRVPPIVHASATDRPPRRSRPPDAGEAADLRARVLHRDGHIIVIDKPAGLAVQGGSKTDRHLDGMLDALAFDGDRPRLVHRLDKDTSGVLLLARSANAAALLTRAFRDGRVDKLYWAVVIGAPALQQGRIDQPLAKRFGVAGERVGADEAGLRAVTEYRVVERAGRRAAWLALHPLTGRTHQLRAHCAVLGTPILGDGKYGGAAAFLEGEGIGERLHLHARTLRFPHPGGGELQVTAPLPKHLRATFHFFGFSERLGRDMLDDVRGDQRVTNAGQTAPLRSSAARPPVRRSRRG
ncbi:MAG: RluA family pseudouridine synthase [Rhodospirillales bacterium]|nr:RluA family pseudouridine synthase [Rhodospirillales bacterium]